MNIIARSSTTAENTRALEFDKNIFDLETIKRAAIKFTASASFSFSHLDDTIKVTINFLIPFSIQEVTKLIDEFNIEVLDQDLRKRVAAETEDVRNLILANVFSKITIPPA